MIASVVTLAAQQNFKSAAAADLSIVPMGPRKLSRTILPVTDLREAT